MMSQSQYDHLKANEEKFFELMNGDRSRTLDEYLTEYRYRDRIYDELVADMGLEPVE